MDCDNCKKSYTIMTGFSIEDYSADEYVDTYLCSPSCLVEWAWGLKEAQEKMSKSKNEPKLDN